MSILLYTSFEKPLTVSKPIHDVFLAQCGETAALFLVIPT
jgi:hypothetical protein